jgi:type IV pilus assembly protein PilV
MELRNTRFSQRGSLLIEGLIAILIFSMGILAIVGMQANAIGHVTDAKFRADAAFFANQIIAQMWADTKTLASLQLNYNTGNGKYNAWKTAVTDPNTGLPGAVGNPPTIDVTPAAPLPGSQVTVTVNWLPPNSTTVHRHIAVAYINDPE